jgi:transcriptional regulator with XRE-family HTH domain
MPARLHKKKNEPANTVELLNGDFAGSELRELRRARSMTLAELALASGLSVGHLSQIERGVSQPSVKALQSLARALGVTVSWFFKAAGATDEAERGYIVRRGSRRKLSFDQGVTDELLSPNLSRGIELLSCTLPPGAESGAEPYTHRGEESGVVIQGKLELWVGDRYFVLGEGDSFAFASDEPHRTRNPGNIDTVVIWAISPPTY